MLSVSPQVAAAIAGKHEFCHLVKMELADGTINMTDNGFPIVWQGNTYEANGLLIGMDAPSFSTEIRINEISLAFTAAEQSMVALMLNKNQINRYVKIHRAYLDANGQVIPDPILLHSWLIVSPDIADQKDSSQITLALASEWSDFEAVRGRRTTDNSHQRLFPGDKGFEFSALINNDLKWGGA